MAKIEKEINRLQQLFGRPLTSYETLLLRYGYACGENQGRISTNKKNPAD